MLCSLLSGGRPRHTDAIIMRLASVSLTRSDGRLVLDLRFRTDHHLGHLANIRAYWSHRERHACSNELDLVKFLGWDRLSERESDSYQVFHAIEICLFVWFEDLTSIFLALDILEQCPLSGVQI